jgi:hypothetical protein
VVFAVALLVVNQSASVCPSMPHSSTQDRKNAALEGAGKSGRVLSVLAISGSGRRVRFLGSCLQEERTKAEEALKLEMDALEKQLQEASKARESRLRKAGIPQRARMSAELREMDAHISALSRTLAVRRATLRSPRGSGPCSLVLGAALHPWRAGVRARQGRRRSLARACGIDRPWHRNAAARRSLARAGDR